ncbi:MAG: hypothetical protein WD826_01105 [Actinomycetota bacterium]
MSNHDPELDVSTGGPERAPRSVVQRLIRLVVTVFGLIIGVTLIALVADRLPEGTQTSALVTRGAIAFVVGLVLIVTVRRMLAALAGAPPAPPRKVDARPIDVVYECPVCGTRVRLEVAATAKAPKHCGEEMEASVSNP